MAQKNEEAENDFHEGVPDGPDTSMDPGSGGVSNESFEHLVQLVQEQSSQLGSIEKKLKVLQEGVNALIVANPSIVEQANKKRKLPPSSTGYDPEKNKTLGLVNVEVKQLEKKGEAPALLMLTESTEDG